MTASVAIVLLLALAGGAQAQRALTLEERIACRERVENVYWAHRIWPQENKTPKPVREMVVPRSVIAARVEESLRYEAAIEELWKKPLSQDVIQSELDRQAQNTRDPQMLRDLWAALDYDPYLIAECLVRPELAERRIKEWYANDRGLHAETRARAEREIASSATIDDLRGRTGGVQEVEWVMDEERKVNERTSGVVALALDDWERMTTELAAALAPRPLRNSALHRAAIQAPVPKSSALPLHTLSALREDGERFYVQSLRSRAAGNLHVVTVSWPKVDFARWWSDQRRNVSPASPRPAKYVLTIQPAGSSCVDNTWTAPPALTPTAPRARAYHTAIWTGSEMIVWGGLDNYGQDPYFNSGGRYTPATDSWVATNTATAPADRREHTAVWTGSEMIVWGGFGSLGYLNSGGRYSPGTDSWVPTDSNAAPVARYGHTAVWTGSEMIVWGGDVASGPLNTGGRYVPGSDSWVATNTSGAPAGHSYYLSTAVWTGTEMIVWGGEDASGYYNDGGRYKPSTDSWTATGSASAPLGRGQHQAVWTGGEMIVWGGWNGSDLDSGGRYSPATDSWSATNASAAPAGRKGHTAIWTGSEMIVWGGYALNLGYLNTGGRYSPGTDSWLATNAGAAPSPRFGQTAVWTGSEMIVWSGSGPAGYTNSGGRYSPGTDSWVATSTGAPLVARSHHTSIWTGSEMIVWGGTDGFGNLNTGGRYTPGTDSWALTGTTRAPAARDLHTAVWTGNEMIVWGGSDGSADLDTGARYSPATDSWLATYTGGAPLGRQQHTAIWTGSEMIVWGGSSYGLALQNGGRYSPATDLWGAATSAVTSPSARYAHSAVWTGSEMIVWGGWDGNTYDNEGGRYTPETDTWSRMSSVPTGRQWHSAVWTGREMIIWGGFNAGSDLNTGASYTPETDGWRETSTVGAPESRFSHTAVWTGSEMIVWGGGKALSTAVLDSGGRYTPGADNWVATDTSAAPESRYRHTAVWTGNAMVVWGGESAGFLNSGASYCALPHPTSFFTVTPCRLFDSRSGPPIASGVETILTVAGHCGIGTGASAVALNLTVVGPSGDGFLTAYPNPGQTPATSTINFRSGQTRANNAVLALAPDGSLQLKFSILANGRAHAVVDVVGFFD
jgi:N-acetylneuraminic acid mutarotase